jgi:hypothetical protein
VGKGWNKAEENQVRIKKQEDKGQPLKAHT